MQTIRGKVEGDTDISADTELFGMVVGEVRVKPGTTLELQGMVVGSLSLEIQSCVNLRGTVNGRVLNRGGNLSVFGTVHGDVVTEAGRTEIDIDALIDGVVQPAVGRKKLAV